MPNATWCPWNFFRTSGDIDPAWDSFFSNLQTTKAYQDYKEPLAKPVRIAKRWLVFVSWKRAAAFVLA